MSNQTNLLSKEKTQSQNRIWVRISNTCNNKCIFCLDSYSHNGTFVNEDIIKKQIKSGYKKGLDNRIIISGGEASINPKFIEYIKYAKKIGYNRIQTITNGVQFFDEKFTKETINSGLEEITFSFHGHNGALHDYLVSTPGAFKKSIKGLIYIKKNYPNIIINIDIVVNKVNVKFLPDIVKFFMKLGVYEYDILHIVPFGRGYDLNKDKLFYNIGDNLKYLQKTWELSKIPGMYMWTNRFPAESFELGYEDLIQDPRKIKGEFLGESSIFFEPFISSKGEIKTECFGEKCNYCFNKSFCNDFVDNIKSKKIKNIEDYEIISGEEFISQIYKKYGENKDDFIRYLKNIKKPIVNIPKCLGGTGIFETYNDINPKYILGDYVDKYISNLYRKKSIKCTGCKYNKNCEGIHINFIRAYGFNILQPIIE